jgi:hypothetical protein
MRFLRMLTNAVIAGALGAAYLTVLVLQLNPQVPLASGTTWRWFSMLAASYGVHLAVLFYVLMVAREFFSLDVLSPGWVSVRVLAWLTAGVASVAALLMWLNVHGFRAALDDVAARRMTVGAVATAVSGRTRRRRAVYDCRDRFHRPARRRQGSGGSCGAWLVSDQSRIAPGAASDAACAAVALRWGLPRVHLDACG